MDGRLNQPQKIADKIAEYAKDPLGFLVMVGKNGTGKTFAAEHIVSLQRFKQKFFDSDHRKIINQAMLNLQWLNQLNDWKDATYLLNQYFNYRILVLDDIGTRIPTDAFMDFLYAIVDYRWTMRLNIATIITTNLSAKDMRNKFGDAFASRISSGIIIKFDGADRRLKNVTEE